MVRREAVKLLLGLYRRWYSSIFCVGLGSSANDLPLLSQVDRPLLIRKPDGSWDSEVVENMISIERTQAIGPPGWKEAVEKILNGTD